jgi:preprotein translocase subunit SecY
MKKIIDQLVSIFKTKEIRKKVLFSLIVLIVFRLLAAIPVVGIPADALIQLFSGSAFGEILSTVSGGVLETASIVAIGLTPYINASIVFQLLGSVFPALEDLRKQGPEGRRKISMYTRFATVPLAILQSFVIYSTLKGFGLVGDLSTLELITMSATLTGGSMIMMWLSELVSESGIGGGSSYLIFLGIIGGIPGTLRANLVLMDPLQKSIFIGMTLVLIISAIFITQAERRVSVQYSRRVRAGGTLDNYIPIKLTQSGVMPVIFAMSLVSFPQLIAQFLVSRDFNEKVTLWSNRVLEWLSDPLISNIIIFVCIILFSFFYLTVVFNTEELAENLQKQGAFIQGIRPGKSTSEYLRGVAFRLTAIGALFLAVISILPNVLIELNFMTTTVVSGTGLLIVVGVIMDIKRDIESMMVVRSYDKYLK